MINNTDKVELTKEQAMKILCALSNSIIDECAREFNTNEQMDKLWDYLYEGMETIENQIGINLENGLINVDTLEFEEW